MNRLVRPVSFTFEPDVVQVYGRAAFGAAGAPTLDTARSKGICNWSKSSQVWTGTTTNSSTAVTGMVSLWGVYNGMTVTGTGIPASTTVTAVNPTAGTLTLSQAATGSATVALTFSGGQYIVTFGSQYTPFKRLDTYVKLLQLTYNWDSIPNEALGTASTPQAPAAPFLFLVGNQVAFSNQTWQVTGTLDGSTAVITAVSNTGGILPGTLVSGLGISAGAYVLAVTSTTVTISSNTTSALANSPLVLTPINPASLIVQCGYYTSTFTGTALGTHSHDLKIIGGQAPSTTNDIAVYTATLGKEAATDATVLGSASATLGGVIAASAGTPVGTVGTPVFIAANPASGEILRLGFDLARSNAI